MWKESGEVREVESLLVAIAYAGGGLVVDVGGGDVRGRSETQVSPYVHLREAFDLWESGNISLAEG